jgi:hypothetical protein
MNLTWVDYAGENHGEKCLELTDLEGFKFMDKGIHFEQLAFMLLDSE